MRITCASPTTLEQSGNNSAGRAVSDKRTCRGVDEGLLNPQGRRRLPCLPDASVDSTSSGFTKLLVQREREMRDGADRLSAVELTGILTIIGCDPRPQVAWAMPKGAFYALAFCANCDLPSREYLPPASYSILMRLPSRFSEPLARRLPAIGIHELECTRTEKGVVVLIQFEPELEDSGC
jgi:hypothetical protein